VNDHEEIPGGGRRQKEVGGKRNKERGGRSASRRRDRRSISVSRGRMREVEHERVEEEKVRSTSRGRRRPKPSPLDPEESQQHADEVKSCRQRSRSRRRHSERRMSKSSNDLLAADSYQHQDKLEGSSRGGRRRHKSSSPQDKVKEHRPQHEPLSRSSSADVRGSRRQSRSSRSKPRSRTYSHDNPAMSNYDYEAAEQADQGGVLASPHHTPKSQRHRGLGRSARQVKNEINLLIDSNGRGQFHISTKNYNHDDTTNNTTSNSDGSSTSNTQLTFDIQIDESSRRYLIHTSMGQLDKIREIHSNMNILRTLSHWNTVQKNNHEYEFVGQLGIVPKNNGKTNLIMMTLMGEYTMSSNWENDGKFSSELERFVEDALQFHLCLNGLDNSASTAATDNSGRRRDDRGGDGISMNDDTYASGSKIRGTDGSGGRGTKSALSAGGGSLRNLFNKTR